MDFTKVKFKVTSERNGQCAVWAVDEKGRLLHTEPICSVYVPWHSWFIEWLERIEDCGHTMPAVKG